MVSIVFIVTVVLTEKKCMVRKLAQIPFCIKSCSCTSLIADNADNRVIFENAFTISSVE